eukprot:scaffold141505_cov55-Attheya_sp.AAC.1
MEGGGMGTITHFDFEAMVHSLLSDPRISASLLINWENPNEGVSHSSSTIACDRAHCDEGGKSRLSLEPMLFTLAIIPQELRVHEWAWRPLGYLNNLHLAPSAKISARLSGQNVRNTHRMLRIMFAGLESLMEDGGLEIEGLEDTFVIGNCKGHDVLCGRYASHKILMLCRDCNCSLSDADDHTVECVMRKVADIKVLTDQPPTREVLSQLQLLKPAEVIQFDGLSQGFSDQHTHQSYRDFPRTSFPHGFSNVTHLQGHEYVGCLLLTTLILASCPWKE